MNGREYGYFNTEYTESRKIRKFPGHPFLCVLASLRAIIICGYLDHAGRLVEAVRPGKMDVILTLSQFFERIDETCSVQLRTWGR